MREDINMKRNKYGEILETEMIKAIEEADTIEDIVNLREILEEDDVEARLDCSSLLTTKEFDYGLGL